MSNNSRKQPISQTKLRKLYRLRSILRTKLDQVEAEYNMARTQFDIQKFVESESSPSPKGEETPDSDKRKCPVDLNDATIASRVISGLRARAQELDPTIPPPNLSALDRESFKQNVDGIKDLKIKRKLDRQLDENSFSSLVGKNFCNEIIKPLRNDDPPPEYHRCFSKEHFTERYIQWANDLQSVIGQKKAKAINTLEQANLNMINRYRQLTEITDTPQVVNRLETYADALKRFKGFKSHNLTNQRKVPQASSDKPKQDRRVAENLIRDIRKYNACVAYKRRAAKRAGKTCSDSFIPLREGKRQGHRRKRRRNCIGNNIAIPDNNRGEDVAARTISSEPQATPSPNTNSDQHNIVGDYVQNEVGQVTIT